MNEPTQHEDDGREVTGERKIARVAKRGLRFSPIWLIPILVASVVVYVLYDAVMRRGEMITLTFQSADGLVPGETPIKHKNVRLGTVHDVHLSDDLSHVDVRVRVERHGGRVLTDRARFWVVRPRLSAGGLVGLQNGLEALVSGAYIAVDPGPPGGRKEKRFKGLEEPPGVRSDEPGRVFTLRTDRLGSLSAGAPVYYREVAAGEVLKYEVGDPGQPMMLQVFVREPFDRYVTDKTRFWNVSGLAVNVGPEGLRVELESLQAFLAGGIAFETSLGDGTAPAPASEHEVFTLHRDKAAADAAAIDGFIPCVAYFASSVQGLGAGAAVQLLGTPIGIVREIRLVNDSKHPGGWLARVAFDLQPARIATADGATPINAASLREHPPRVVLESVNIVTGQKALTLDFRRAPPGAAAAAATAEGGATVLLGEGGGFEDVAASFGKIAAKLEQVPFDEIGKNLDLTLRSLQATLGGEDLRNAIRELSSTMTDMHHLVGEADRGLGPALVRLPALLDQLRQLTKQGTDAARSMRLLADYLERHPEAIVRGRNNETSER